MHDQSAPAGALVDTAPAGVGLDRRGQQAPALPRSLALAADDSKLRNRRRTAFEPEILTCVYEQSKKVLDRNRSGD